MNARAADCGAALVCLVLPAAWIGRTVGKFRAPGVEADALFEALAAAALARGGGAPASPSPAFAALQAVLPAPPNGAFDPAFAYGVVVFLAVWLAGFGPWRLARVWAPEAPWWAAGLAALAVQTSPMVLRGVPDADLVALGVGAAALGLAHPPLALGAGAFGAPAAALYLCAGVGAALRRDRRAAWWLVAGLWVAPAVLAEGDAARAIWRTPRTSATVPAYVTEGGAVFPLPPVEAAPVVARAQAGGLGLWSAAGVEPRGFGNRFAAPPGGPTPVKPAGAAPDRPAGGAPGLGGLWVWTQRAWGGPALVVGLLLGLAVRGRRVASVVGVALLAALTIGWGWAPLPGELERDPDAARALGGALSLADRPGTALGWAALPAVLAAPGLAAALGRLGRGGVVVGLGLALAGIPLENPRLASPVANVPPEPFAETLRGMAPGALLVFPNPAAPWHQGGVPLARLRYIADRDHPLADPRDPDAVAALARLSVLVGHPVDQSAAPLAEGAPGSVALGAVSGAWRYLVVDYDALPRHEGARVDGWLAAQVGPPVANVGARRIYDRAALVSARGAP